MGLLLLALLAVAVLGGVWSWARPTREALAVVASALLLGAAGYVLQGRPALDGSPTPPRANHPAADTLFAAERGVWLGRSGAAADLLTSADGLIAHRAPGRAVALLREAVARDPGEMELWIGLGNALATYADGQVTPAARYAFARAGAIAPGDPAPAYFLGLAYAEAGDLETAERTWRALLAATPPGAPYRKLIERRVEVMARMRAA